MRIDAMTGSIQLSGLGMFSGGTTHNQPSDEAAVSYGSDAALQREQDKTAAEREKIRQEREQQLKYIRDYIETQGAPEEKEQQAQQTFLQKLQEEEDEKRRQGLPGLANRTWGVTIQDPNDEGKMHVIAVKTDMQGKAKITRHMQFDSGDGQDRSKLTPERAKAAKAYESQATNHSTANPSNDDSKKV